jgi:uncharacterized protein (TIGR03435 family)
MTRETKTLTRFLQRFFSPTEEQMESARNRILQRLELGCDGVAPEFRVAMNPLPVASRPWLPRLAFTIAAAAAVLVLSVILVTDFQRATDRTIEPGEIVRSNLAGLTLALSDGSRVEMRSDSELELETAADGLRLRLNSGSIIVSAAKQQPGRRLYVQTRDVAVSVVGTVFLVNAEEEGSRVAVVEGRVQVQHGTTEKRLQSGEHLATSPTMPSQPVEEEISWSRNAEQYLALLLQATTPPPPPLAVPATFEEATIRPTGVAAGNDDDACSHSPAPLPGMINPGRFVATNTTVYALIALAYNPWKYAAGACSAANGSNLITGGPEWIKTQRFDIQALIPKGSPTYENLQLWQGEAPKLQAMIQTLLAERFKLVAHPEMKEMPVYFLMAEKGSSKFAASMSVDRPAASEGIFTGSKTENGTRYSDLWFRKVPMARVAWRLGISASVRRPVVDRTGLTGEFDFDLQFDETGVVRPPLFNALQEQLGLKLEPSRAPIETLVIDRVEKPSEN